MEKYIFSDTGYLHTLEGRLPFDAPRDPSLREDFLVEQDKQRPKLPPFTPEQKEAFAEQVQYIQEHGDALQIPLFTNKRLGANSLALAGIVAPAAAATGNTALSFYSAAVLGAGGILFSWLRHRFVHLPRSQKKMAYQNQELLDERYDIFTMPAVETKGTSNPAHMALRYYGPREVTTQQLKEGAVPATIDRLRRIAELAEGHGITEIIVSQKMLGHISDETTAMRTVSGFLKDRGLPIDTHKSLPIDTDIIARLSPQKIRELEGIRYRHQPRTAEINHLITGLRSISPDHPLVRAYDQYEKYPDQREKALARLLSVAVERDESLTEAVGISWKAEGKNTSDETPTVQKTRLHLKASLHYGEAAHVPDDKEKWPEWMKDEDARTIRESSGTTVQTIWTDSAGGQIGGKSLEQLTGLSKEEMKLLLRNPDSDRTKATTLFIGLLAQLLHNGQAEVEVNSGKDFTEDRINSVAKHLFLGPTVQEQLLPHKPGDTRKIIGANTMWMKDEGLWVRGVAGVFCAGVLSLGSWLGTQALDSHYEAGLGSARAEIARSQGLDIESIPPSEAQRLARDRSPINHYYGWLKDGATSISRSLPFPSFTTDVPLPFKFPEGKGASSSPEYTSLRNNQAAPNTAEWFLRTHGTISIEGHWASSTASSLDYGSERLGWVFGQGTRTVDLELPDKYIGTAPNIEVERNLTQKDGTDLFHIPVRHGTKVVAANIDGKPVTVWLQSDHTYSIQTKEKLTGNKLRFWVVEDPSARNPKAIREIMPRDKGKRVDRAAIQREWERVMPGFTAKSPQEQEASIRRYIQEHFDYQRNPYPESFKIDKKDPGGTYTKDRIKEERADCEAGSTLVSLNFLTDNYTPPARVVINPAAGYLNKSGTGANLLTTREGHQWNVDPEGQVLDATPSKNITQEDADYLSGRDSMAEAGSNNSSLALGALGVMSVLIAGGISQRERIQKQWHRFRRKQYERQENQRAKNKQKQADEPPLTPGEKAFTAEYETDAPAICEALQAALYDPKQDIAGAIKRAQDMKYISSESALKKLSRNDVQAKTSIAAIKNLIRNSSGQERYILERSLKAIKAARRLKK